MTPITGELDPGIADVVQLLRESGIDTIASCQGGEGHAFAKPTVRVQPIDSTNMDIDEVHIALLLSEAGYGGYYIKQIHAYQRDTRPWAQAGQHFLEIEFGGDILDS